MEKEYKLLLSCPSGLTRSQVKVNLDESYDRVPHPDIQLENSVSEIWDQSAHHHGSVFEGKKFRYGGHDGVEPNVCLHLGLTDYSTFVGLNLGPSWERFLVPSEGNDAIVETGDSKILLLERNDIAEEFPGYLFFPGGYPHSELLFIGISRRELNAKPVAFFYIKCSLQSTEIHESCFIAEDTYESKKLYTVQPSELEHMASKMPGCQRGGLELYKLMLAAGKNVK